jgi:hypothetical protein
MLTPHTDANVPTAVDVDYTLPVVRAQKQFRANAIIRIIRATSSIRERWRVDQIVGKFQEAVTRLLRRYLALRR